ncbi:DUF4132 domain-containing protein [bacterium]|nr:MAG: DUF4132 domain-containing protein [bacterium]
MRTIPDSYNEKISEMLTLPIAYRNSSYVWGNPIATQIVRLPAEEQANYLFAIFERGFELEAQDQRPMYLLGALVGEILKTQLPLSEEDFTNLLQAISNMKLEGFGYSLGNLLVDNQIGQFDLKPPLTPVWRQRIGELRQLLSPNYSPSYSGADWSVAPRMQKLAELLGGLEEGVGERGDDWVDAASTDLKAMNAEQRALWVELLSHARNSKDSKPKEKWLNRADELITPIGHDELLAHLQKWLPLFGKDDGWWFADREDSNDAPFKGLVWMASRIQDPAIIRALGAALRGSVKSRGRAGVRSQKVCNAILWVLSSRDEVEAVAAIAAAKRVVKHGAILKTIEKALTEIATRLQVAPDELEELSIPDFGLENGGWKRDFDGNNLEVSFSTGKAIWNWTSKDGKALKSAPASVKTAFGDELKELKTQASEVEKVLITIKDRLDLAVRDEKVWPLEAWQERYLLHSLASLVATRVIWEWSADGNNWSGFVPQLDSPTIPNGAQIRLWHPIFHSVEIVLQWRQRLEDNAIQQPWKQAHREIYRLTDAERTTETYSNRFAAHILKQHQFNALCTARGWKNQLRLMVDDSYKPATKYWPRYGMRVEFWIEGSGDNYGEDTNETGTYWRLVTDQVRFYPQDAPENHAHASGGGYAANYRNQPVTALRLEEIPPLIFSETMRDVDLFVGVSSIGNDPTWQDGGPQGHFRDYWERYGFGELEESAKSRADTLSRLIPRLKIRDKARIEGRFLHVKGQVRDYKIHLGSGNILMEPNDQYLCIVPKSGGDSELLLPFEGDRTLTLIISKAFLLAEDDKIKDQTILSQIRRE